MFTFLNIEEGSRRVIGESSGKYPFFKNIFTPALIYFYFGSTAPVVNTAEYIGPFSRTISLIEKLRAKVVTETPATNGVCFLGNKMRNINLYLQLLPEHHPTSNRPTFINPNNFKEVGTMDVARAMFAKKFASVRSSSFYFI